MSIICGTDLSDASSGTLDVACALAAARGDREVILVHIVDPDHAGDEEMQAARARLDAQVKSHTGTAIRTELVVGPAEDSLLGLAETEHCDLIVIAARSTSTTNKKVGSTTANLIARTHVPMLMVRDAAPWLAFAKGERPLRVMLGVDDTATSELGIQWVQALRIRGPMEVVLAAIYYPDDAAEYYGVEMRSAVDRDPEIEKLMERDMARRFGGDLTGVVTRARRGLGRIGDHLVELAEAEKADVIVLGTSQKTGLGRLGSVSSVVVHESDTSVVCIPPQAVLSTITVPLLKGVLVATDLSSFSNRAVPWAFAVAEPDAEIHVAHVVKDDEVVDIPEVTRALYALAPAGAKQVIRAHIVHGDDAAKAIAQCAARLGVDVICIASHGRSGITRALVGSVADRLLRATRKPVLVLRPA
jgi:nucleotide-binding universal stress UspA family protein